MATGTINNPYKIEPEATAQSAYGTVTYYRCGKIVQVFVNCTNIPTNAWTILTSDLPKPVASLYFVGLNGASAADISLLLGIDGKLSFYGRDSIYNVLTGFVYITKD